MIKLQPGNREGTHNLKNAILSTLHNYGRSSPFQPLVQPGGIDVIYGSVCRIIKGLLTVHFSFPMINNLVAEKRTTVVRVTSGETHSMVIPIDSVLVDKRYNRNRTVRNS